MSIERAPESPRDPVQDEAGRHSRIEELLLEGLDHYFAARYEHAITVWTRVAFLERGHGRARAYIERARSAQAEQQRQAEELVHAGVSAYHAGELDAARDLLTRALNEGGPHETALAYLQRLGRADSGSVSSRLAAQARHRPRGDAPSPAV
jgi:D-serine deaminase-like pyridoxal phosphate-dependent protein